MRSPSWLLALSFAASGCTFLDPLGDLSEGPAPQRGAVEGFGKSATGGNNECRVKSSVGTGPDTLAGCLKSGDRLVSFDVDSVSLDTKAYVFSNTTIDGCAAGRKGVTVEMPSDTEAGIRIEANDGPLSNVIVRCIRFQGHGKTVSTVHFDLLSIDGQSYPVSNILVDRCTFIAAPHEAIDIAYNVADVTVQRSLFYGTAQAMQVKYATRDRISLHHNVYTHNGENNPLIGGGLGYIDFVSNVVHDWSITTDTFDTYTPFGLRIEQNQSDSPGVVNANVIANAFLSSPATAFQMVGTGGSVFYADNNRCDGCPLPTDLAPEPVPLPAGYEAFGITPTAVDKLASELLPTVGAPNRTSGDQDYIDKVKAAF